MGIEKHQCAIKNNIYQLEDFTKNLRVVQFCADYGRLIPFCFSLTSVSEGPKNVANAPFFDRPLITLAFQLSNNLFKLTLLKHSHQLWRTIERRDISLNREL